MDLVELTKRKHRDLYDACDKGALQKLSRSLDRGKGLTVLLQSNDALLRQFTASQLSTLSDVHRELTKWKNAVRELRKTLAQSRLTLPDGSINNATTSDELHALERTARMCPRASFQDHSSWANAVQAHLKLWSACVKLGLSTGTVSISMADAEHLEADEFERYVCTKNLIKEMRGYQWLATKRGEQAGILSISINVPVEELENQAIARLSTLGLSAGKQGAKGVLQELVLDNLNSTILAILDEQAEAEALSTAASAYTDLITALPIKAKQILAVHVSTTTAPAGVVILDNKGEPTLQIEVTADTSLTEKLKEISAANSIDTLVMPVSSADNDRLRECADTFDNIPIARILPAALKEARKDLSFSPMISNAVIIGRRALKPATEWARVTPASIGLGEYSSELPHERLAEILNEARALAIWEQKNKKSARQRNRDQRSSITFSRLNPLIRTIRDLKPDMSVDGVVTNLTRFGAFVNIGLSTEAMIHVSQLSVDFIDDPSQVVKVGQNVTARILEVMPEKNRIALSLKPVPVKGEKPQRDSRLPAPSRGEPLKRGGPSSYGTPPPPGRGGKDEGKKSRREALADLDALFKK